MAQLCLPTDLTHTHTHTHVKPLQVDWNERWLWGLGGFHATTLTAILITRGRPYVQAVIFCLLGKLLSYCLQFMEDFLFSTTMPWCVIADETLNESKNRA